MVNVPLMNLLQVMFRIIVTSSLYKIVPLTMEIICQNEFILNFQKAGPNTNDSYTNEIGLRMPLNPYEKRLR